MPTPVELDSEDGRAETDLHFAVAHLFRTLRAADSHPDSVWALMTAGALELPPVNYASIFIVGPGTCAWDHGATHDHARTLNTLEQRHMQGPGVDAACERQTRRVDDLEEEVRWPEFSDEATAMTPIRSILSLPLLTHHRRKVVPNLYADQPHSFGTAGELMGYLFAVEAETVLGASFGERRLRKALTNRDLIGHAKEILLQRFDIDPVTASSLLAQLSRNRQQSVTAVAEELVRDDRGHASRRVLMEVSALVARLPGSVPCKLLTLLSEHPECVGQ